MPGLFITIIIIFLHGLGRLNCSGIYALPSFPWASTISSSSGFVVEDVFRETNWSSKNGGFGGRAGNPPKENKILINRDAQLRISAWIVKEYKYCIRLWNHTKPIYCDLKRETFPFWTYINIFFFPMPPHVLCGLRGTPSWAWQECNRLLSFGSPWCTVKLSRWRMSGDRGGCSARRGLKPKFY